MRKKWWFVDINYSPKITEKLWIVCLVAADKPLPEGRVKEHVGGVFTQIGRAHV